MKKLRGRMFNNKQRIICMSQVKEIHFEKARGVYFYQIQYNTIAYGVYKYAGLVMYQPEDSWPREAKILIRSKTEDQKEIKTEERGSYGVGKLGETYT